VVVTVKSPKVGEWPLKPSAPSWPSFPEKVSGGGAAPPNTFPPTVRFAVTVWVAGSKAITERTVPLELKVVFVQVPA